MGARLAQAVVLAVHIPLLLFTMISLEFIILKNAPVEILPDMNEQALAAVLV